MNSSNSFFTHDHPGTSPRSQRLRRCKTQQMIMKIQLPRRLLSGRQLSRSACTVGRLMSWSACTAGCTIKPLRKLQNNECFRVCSYVFVRWCVQEPRFKTCAGLHWRVFVCTAFCRGLFCLLYMYVFMFKAILHASISVLII